MKNNVETVTIFRTWIDLAETLRDAERGKLYHAICRYSLYGEEPVLEIPLSSFFELMRPSINKSNARKIAQQTGVQARLQKRLQNGLQNESQAGSQGELPMDLQTGSQSGSQNGCIRARKTGTGTGKKTGSKEPAKEKISFVGLIPANLQDETFKKAWLDWEDARREQKKKLTPKAVQGQLELLASYSPHVAAEMLRASIRNGWQGIFPLDNQPRKPSPAPKDHNGI